MRGFLLLVAFFLVISCYDSDKASGEKNQRIWIDAIDYGIYRNKLYILGILESEVKSCTALKNLVDCKPDSNNCWVINGKYIFVSLENLDACYLKDYIWIVNEDTTTSSSERTYNIGYGEHFVKLILVDTFGDSISESTYLRVDEPLSIIMLSPVNGYEAHRNDTLAFQYRISGLDTWEPALEDTVYISTDENVLKNKALLWEEGRALKNKFLRPPLNEQVYYWGVKASNQDTAFYSEIRSVWIKNLVY